MGLASDCVGGGEGSSGEAVSNGGVEISEM